MKYSKEANTYTLIDNGQIVGHVARTKTGYYYSFNKPTDKEISMFVGGFGGYGLEEAKIKLYQHLKSKK